MSIRILQCGAGIRGSHWAKFVAEYPDTVPVAYVDSDPEALERLKRSPGRENCQYFTDMDEALRSVEADAAIIATPSILHAEHTFKALDAGLAVMVEKPFATSVADAIRLLERAKGAGRPLMVAENYRYFRAEQTVRQLLRDNFLGGVDSVSLTDRRRMPSHTEGPWLASIKYPQLQEIAIHHFDSLRSFFNRKPLNITARVWNPPWSDYQHGPCTAAHIEMEGLQVQYLGTMTSHRFSCTFWIEGERGVLWTDRKLVFWRPRGKRFFRPLKLISVPRGDGGKYPQAGTTSLLNNLRDAVLYGKIPETSGEDNIWNVAMVEAGKRSDAERRTVAIDEVFPGVH